MSDPWAAFPTTKPVAPSAPSVAPAADPWASFPTEKPQSKAFTGGILPFSVDEQGRGKLDFDAGIIGGLKRAFTTPGDVMSGKLDLNTDEGFGRALELSGFASPVPPAIRAGKLGMMEPKVQPPTTKALEQAADAGYTAVREMGVDYAAPAVTDMVGSVRMALEKDGIIGELAPKTYAVLQKLSNPPEGGFMSLSGLEAARRAAGLAAKDVTNGVEAAAASRLIQGIDDFIARADPNSVLAGPATAAAERLAPARSNYAAAKRSDAITGLEERADLQAAANNSGRNLDNTIRQRVTSVLTNPDRVRGFSPEEVALLEQVVFGDGLRNGLRNASNMMGGGGGLGAVVTGLGTGALTGGAAGAGIGAAIGTAVPVAGGLARWVQNALARRSLNKVDEATRMRSPLYEEAKGAATPQPRDMREHTATMGAGTATTLRAPQSEPIDQDALKEALRKLILEGGA